MGETAFGVNYVDVGYFQQGPPLNSFQLVLIDRSDDQTLAILTLSSTMTKFSWEYWNV